MIRPTRGRARVAGFDVVEQPIDVKRRIGYVPETAALYDSLPATEYLELVACLHHLDRKTADTRSNELRSSSSGSPPKNINACASSRKVCVRRC
jgi:ABC-2 type transport system ATP-binding protein